MKKTITDKGGRKFQVKDLSFAGEDLEDYANQAGGGKDDNPELVEKVDTMKALLRYGPKLAREYLPDFSGFEVRKPSAALWVQIGKEMHRRNVEREKTIQKKIKDAGIEYDWTMQHVTELCDWIFGAMALVAEADNFYDALGKDFLLTIISYHESTKMQKGDDYLNEIVRLWAMEDEIWRVRFQISRHKTQAECGGCPKCDRLTRKEKKLRKKYDRAVKRYEKKDARKQRG